MSEGGLCASAGGATQAAPCEERVAGRVDVVAEVGEALLDERGSCLVAKEVVEHRFGLSVEGVELGEGDVEALVWVLDRRPNVQLGQRVGGGPVSAAGVEECRLVGEVAVDGRAPDAGVRRHSAD